MFGSTHVQYRAPRYRVGRLPQGLPDEMRVPLTYAEAISFTSTTGSVSTQIYTGNGPYDPNTTGVGAQPAWWDSFIAMYFHCHVISCRLRLVAKSTSSTVPATISVVPQNESAPAAIVDALTNPWAVSGVLTINTAPFTCDLTMTTKDMLGTSLESLRATPTSGATQIANPSSGYDWYWVTKIQSTDGASTTSALVEYVLVYDCLFTRRESSDEDVQYTHLKDRLERAERLAERRKELNGRPLQALDEKEAWRVVHEKLRLNDAAWEKTLKQRYSSSSMKSSQFSDDEWEVRSIPDRGDNKENIGRTEKKTSGASVVRSKSVK